LNLCHGFNRWSRSRVLEDSPSRLKLAHQLLGLGLQVMSGNIKLLYFQRSQPLKLRFSFSSKFLGLSKDSLALGTLLHCRLTLVLYLRYQLVHPSVFRRE
jgi:hypothetical protein